MKPQIIISLAAGLCLGAGALAQEAPKKGATVRPFKIQEQQQAAKQAQKEAEQAAEEARKALEADPEMKKWLEAGSPGEHHEHMSALVGQWVGTFKMWDAPGAPEQTSETRATVRMDMNGRYLRATHESEFMGMPFRGQAIWGYNNLRKQYESIWIDNMSTGIAFSTGTCDRAGKVFTFTGEVDDPMSGKKVRQREVTTVLDSNSWKLEMYKPGPDGKEFKTFEVTYRSTGQAPAQAQRRAGRAAPVQDGDETKTPSPSSPK